MVKFNNQKARKFFTTYTIANFDKIKVKAGKCRYNFRCQYNAVHEAKKAGDSRIALAIYVDGDYPIIHFLNYQNEEFIDNTLGEWSQRLDYYFVKWIEEEDMWNVDVIFDALRADLRNKLSWWLKITSDYGC